jgi:hypothetical protein
LDAIVGAAFGSEPQLASVRTAITQIVVLITDEV